MLEAVFQSLRSIHHPEVQATRCLIAARFCWPQMAKSVTLMARACLFCQWDNVCRHVQLHPATFLVPHPYSTHKHVNLIGPPPALLWPHASRWPEVIPSHPSLLLTVPDPYPPAGLAESPILECLPSSHLTERLNSHLHYGQPSSTCTTSTTPQQQLTTHKSNRLVEHFHRRLKNALRTRADATIFHG
jgi:hypothetical protein